MTLKKYVRYESRNHTFLNHLHKKPYLKAVVTLSWLFMVFALAFNVSINYFSNKVEGQPLAMVEKNEPLDLNGTVQGIATDQSEDISPPLPLQADDEKDIAENTAKTPRQASYKVALFGDSMIDTMGKKVGGLESALKKKYPDTVFVFYNYGQGAENVEQGLARFDKQFIYSDRNYQPITTLNPDIIILGSYAYNPFVPYDRDKHWLQLAKLVERAKAIEAEVYLLAEIAPLRLDFGRGPQGVNLDSVTAYEKSGEVIQQLENAVGLAKNLNVILINAFEKSLVSARGDGKREYVSSQDGIHASERGQEFMASEIANTLILD